MTTPKIVVLDRDGVINQDSPDYIKNPQEWVPIPGSLEAIARLHRHGYLVTVASNQSGLARGLFDETALARIHQKFIASVAALNGEMAGIFYCPHAPNAGCACRKPETGLLQQIAAQFAVDLTGACFIGDSAKDLQAALAFNMQPVLVRTGNGRETEAGLVETLGKDVQVPVYDNLVEAVQHILDQDVN